MAQAGHQSRVYVIGDFRLRPDELVLERDGATVALTPKAILALLVLAESAGEVVTKDALFECVWPGTFVFESSLTRNISIRAISKPPCAAAGSGPSDYAACG